MPASGSVTRGSGSRGEGVGPGEEPGSGGAGPGSVRPRIVRSEPASGSRTAAAVVVRRSAAPRAADAAPDRSADEPTAVVRVVAPTRLPAVVAGEDWALSTDCRARLSPATLWSTTTPPPTPTPTAMVATATFAEAPPSAALSQPRSS